MFPDLARASILSRVKLFPVLEKLQIQLNHGSHTQQIRCPFHDDRTPSARIYQDTQRIYCFTCGRGWDVIGLVMGKLNLCYTDALLWFDQQFPPPLASEDIAGTLSVLLNSQSKRTDSSQLYMLVERNLIANRKRLGLEKYSKLLLYLDTVMYQRKNSQCSETQAVGYLNQLLRLSVQSSI